MCGTVNLTKNADKKYIYNSSKSFEGGFAQDVILSVDNTSIKHSENANDKFHLVLGEKSYLYVKRTQMCEFKAFSQVPDYNFCLGTISAIFRYDDGKTLLNGAVYTFIVDYNTIIVNVYII